jgi:hypothetical protein
VTPGEHHEANLMTMLDELIAWAQALQRLREHTGVPAAA